MFQFLQPKAGVPLEMFAFLPAQTFIVSASIRKVVGDFVRHNIFDTEVVASIGGRGEIAEYLRSIMDAILTRGEFYVANYFGGNLHCIYYHRQSDLN